MVALVQSVGVEERSFGHVQSYGVGGIFQCAGWTVWLLYYPREIHCPTHRRHLEDIAWADEYAQVSYRYEYMILRYCQLMTQKAAAQLLRVSQSTLSDQLHRIIQRLRSGLRIRGLKSLG
jgi:predicted DNA-binding protein (UPF0251 family)